MNSPRAANCKCQPSKIAAGQWEHAAELLESVGKGLNQSLTH
jgi:hypothetical protein